jgi:hypothetical protein
LIRELPESATKLRFLPGRPAAGTAEERSNEKEVVEERSKQTKEKRRKGIPGMR